MFLNDFIYDSFRKKREVIQGVVRHSKYLEFLKFQEGILEGGSTTEEVIFEVKLYKRVEALEALRVNLLDGVIERIEHPERL